jgi:hypothetical protein
VELGEEEHGGRHHDGRSLVSTSVLCFVAVFDEADRLLSNHLVPPKPAGHRRSSGFDVSPGRQGHVEFPAEGRLPPHELPVPPKERLG